MRGDFASLARTVFAGLAAFLCIGGLGYAFYQRYQVPPAFPAEDTNSQERRQQRTEAVKLRLDLSTKLFDVSVVTLGVLWGLVLAEKVQIKFAAWQDDVLFISSNMLLLLSLLFHLLYRRRLPILLWDLAPRQPDIFSLHVDYLFRMQWVFFFASLVAGFLTLVFAKMLGG